MNTKLRTIIATAGIGLAAISVGGVAAAQSYGDTDPQTAATSDAQVDDSGTLLDIQDTSDAETDGDVAPDAEADTEAEDGRRGHRGGCGLDAAAEAIGIDVDELRDQLDAETSIADVAEANGVDAATVIDAMVADATDELAEKVEEGRLTQDEADERLADLEADITERVTTPGEAGERGNHGGRGDDSDDSDEATEDTAA